MKVKYNRVFSLVKKVNINKFNNLVVESGRGLHIFGNVDKWLVNLSSVPVPGDVLGFLSLGPGFCLSINRDNVNVRKLLMEFEGILSYCPEDSRDTLRARGTNIVTNFLSGGNNDTWLNNHLSSLFKKTKSFLRQNDNVLVTSADKGSVTVLLDRDTYVTKGLDMLNDDHTYQIITKDPVQILQRRTNKLLKDLNNEGHLPENLCQQLIVNNSNLCKCYFLPKIHKEGVPLRPIIAACGSATYHLSTYLASILSDALLSRTVYNVKDTFDFVERVRDRNVPSDHVLISLDVVSLFTNVPWELVKTVVIRHWDLIQDHCNFERDTFLSTLHFIFNNTYFTFQDKIYLQKFGTPMGSPISPILALMVMDYILDSAIPMLPFDLPFIFKFVDDIVACVPRGSVEAILTIFNSIDSHVQFTHEMETDNCLAFLDCKLVRRDGGTLLTDWYTKPSYSGRYINFYSNHTFTHKINTITCMKNRIEKICHSEFRHTALARLRGIFVNNGYPLRLVNKILFSTSTTSTGSIFDIPTPAKPIYLKVTSIPRISEKLKQLFHSVLPENRKIVFHYPYKIRNIFSKIKDRDPLLYASNVVYCIDCKDCEGRYVGSTSQWLKNRISLHKSDCNTNKLRCALAGHALGNGHTFDFENVRVLDRESNYRNRLFLEMFHIKTTTDAVNFKKDVENLSNIYSFIIHLDTEKSNRSNNNMSSIIF